MKNKKISGKSINHQEELLELLKKQAPEIFSEGSVDCQKLKQTLGEEVDLDDERYGMNWAGKSDCFRVIQEQTTATLKPDRKESVDFDKTENLFIEGDNLEVLKVLQKPYYGKVKMIYIDPPYNTGNDFIYKDNFKQDKLEYEKENGIKDENGDLRGDGLMKNTRDKGHFHSNWLKFMYPRLFLARNLLKQDGVIFVSIDDNEVHNLRMIMNEIFGEENFIASFIWEKHKAPKSDNKYVTENHEYVLMYSKIKELFKIKKLPRSKENLASFSNPDNDSRGVWISGPLLAPTYSDKFVYKIKKPGGEKVLPPDGKCWSFSKEKINKLMEDNRIWFGKDGMNVPRIKRFLSELPEGVGVTSMLLHDELSGTQKASNELKRLFDNRKIFIYPKPIKIIDRFVRISTNNKDIVLDFFAGSGTTAHAVMALNAEDGGNRKCISVQLPEETDEKSEAYKAGYKNIADISRERIRRAGKKIKPESKNKLDIGFKAFKLDQSNFKIWRKDIKDEKELIKQMNMFVNNVKTKSTQDNILYELILKSGLDLNVDVVKKEVGKKVYYVVDEGKLIICLENKITQGVVDAILADKPEKVICLDRAFGGNDQLKTNTHLQMESAKVDFKVI